MDPFGVNRFSCQGKLIDIHLSPYTRGACMTFGICRLHNNLDFFLIKTIDYIKCNLTTVPSWQKGLPSVASVPEYFADSQPDLVG